MVSGVFPFLLKMSLIALLTVVFTGGSWSGLPTAVVFLRLNVL
jgi:hypothetical protein